MTRFNSVFAAILSLSFASLAYAPSAQAFCGFYVAGGESSLFNDATQAVLMRVGRRTFYRCKTIIQAAENFAMWYRCRLFWSKTT